MTRRTLAVFDLSMPGWTAGRSYTEALMRSLLLADAARRFDLVRIVDGDRTDAVLDALPFARRPMPPSATTSLTARASGRPTVRRAASIVGRLVDRAIAPAPIRAARDAGAAVALPFAMDLPVRPPFGSVGWIPDFQHVRQPQFFSPAVRADRDAQFRRLATNADRVVLSSHAAHADFVAFAPEHAAKASVASFPSALCFRELPAYARAAAAEFRIPARYALVVNQLWRHKNTELVVEAAALCAARGEPVPVVVVGTPLDTRDAENAPVSELLQAIARRGLTSSITVLGKVSYAQLVELLRGASVVVQPSRFEGWSTTVEDAKCLGRPLLCSDIDVHREQAPDALGFFGCDRPDELARLLARHFPALPPGSGASESASMERERAVAAAFGAAVLEACEAAASAAERR